MRRRLPQSWKIASIKDVTVECEQRIPRADEKFQYIDIASIDRETKVILTPQELMGKVAPSRARKVICTGDVLVSMTRPNLNAVAMVPSKLDGQIASTGFDVLRAPGLDPRWLFYIVRTRSFIDRMSELVQGALYPAIRSKDIRGFEIPIAPLNEQIRIADKLSVVLGRVDASRKRLDRIPAILKRFRQAVLTAATSGKLTEAWRIENGYELNAWEITNFESACVDITVGYVGSMSSEYRDEGVPFLRSMNVRPFKYDPTGIRYISRKFHQQIKKSALQPGDVTVVRTGAPGQCCVIPDSLPEANCSDLVIVRPGPTMLPDFACIFINSETSQAFVRSEQVGVAQSHFNVGSMKRAPLALPSINEQHEIIRRVNSLFTYADCLEARYTPVRDTIDRLTHTLLAKAFHGELVPQDPNDEPASILMDRIHAGYVDRAKQPRVGTFKNSKREYHNLMIKLIDVLTNANDWLTAEDAFRRCGVENGVATDRIEQVYAELRVLYKDGQLEVDQIRDTHGRKLHDRLRLIARS